MSLPVIRRRKIGAVLGAAAIFLISSAWVTTLQAGAVGVPAAVRPGAIRPGQERQTVPQQPPGEVFEVPAVVESPLDIDAGTRIQVSAFELLGVVDRP